MHAIANNSRSESSIATLTDGVHGSSNTSNHQITSGRSATRRSREKIMGAFNSNIGPVVKNLAGRKLVVAAVAALGIASVAADHASASVVTLTSGNSQVKINNGSSAGMYSWLVDGVQEFGKNSLNQQSGQWFWYRRGNTYADHSIDTITNQTVTQTSPNSETVTYTANGYFKLTVNYTLVGGSAGSHTAIISESADIKNIGKSPLDFHFFQYSDFNVAGTPSNDTVQITNGNTARQWDGSSTLAETVVTPAPSRYEVVKVDALTNPSTPNSLNDASPTTLTDAGGPLSGDVAWAFEWDKTLAVSGPGSELLISKSKSISPSAAVPEPSTGLLMTGIAGVALLKRRRAVRRA